MNRIGHVTHRRPTRQLESRAQCAVIKWAELNESRHPELAMLMHIPNGGYALSARQGAQLKRMGLRAGVPDLFLPVARGSFHGLFIEMKAPGETAKPHQRAWHARLKAQGYGVVVRDEAAKAVSLIAAYLKLPNQPQTRPK